MDFGSTVVTGPIVAACMRDNTAPVPDSSDLFVDIYFYGVAPQTARRKVADIQQTIMRNSGTMQQDYRIARTPDSITFSPVGTQNGAQGGAQLHVRVHLTLDRSPGFALRQSKSYATDVLWDGKDVYMSPACLRAMWTGYSHFVPMSTSQSGPDLIRLARDGMGLFVAAPSGLHITPTRARLRFEEAYRDVRGELIDALNIWQEVVRHPMLDLVRSMCLLTVGTWTQGFRNLVRLQVLWDATAGDAGRELVLQQNSGGGAQLDLVSNEYYLWAYTNVCGLMRL
ncbi:hypothetical protein OC834_003576 [Tilletia horrida]|nr:hypothetical protein OC834_003576 [Tilletia horrida]